MRARLVAVFTAPIMLLFVVLGAAYVSNVARSEQQELFLDRLSDASYLVITARQSLTAGDPGLIQDDLERYRQVYGIEAAVLNRTGEVWATNGLDVTAIDERFDALAGRRNELRERLLPWGFEDIVVAEPVFEGEDRLGAVITSSGTERITRNVWLRSLYLGLGAVLAVAVSVLVAYGLARWVLRPLRMVDSAMAEIRSGHMDARIPAATGPPELRQVVTQFNSMAQKVEQLMHKQQEFVSNASHELRNPLNALLLRVEDLALSMSAGSGEHTAEIEHVRAEGRRMTRILDALLMLARDDEMAASSQPVEVRSVIARRVDGWQAIGSDKDVAARLDGATEVWARVDEIVLESAFDAVMDNAVKFAPSGSTVEVSVTANSDCATITVRDHGPGLPAEEITKVTDRFWRSPSHSTVRGSGLGLAIAAELLDTCGGRLHVAPADGGGLAVALQVPTGTAASEDQP